MTKSEQPKPVPLPLLLVYGKPTAPDLPQASWFRAEDRAAVLAAAHSLKFSVLDIQSDPDRAIIVDVHEGVLKGNGRMIVGSVSPEVYERIADFAAKTSLASDATASSKPEGEPKPTTEQNKNIVETSPQRATPPQLASQRSSLPSATSNATATDAPATPNAGPPNPWDTLQVGAKVLAAYWNENREFEGFWLATVKRIDKGEFTLEWLESPEYPTFKTRPKNMAVPHPEFRITGK